MLGLVGKGPRARQQAAACPPSAAFEASKEAGRAAAKEGRLEEAVAAFAACLADAEDDSAVRLSKAVCELKLGRYDDAAADALACVARQPENWKGWDAAGQAELGRRGFTEAHRCFTETLKLNPLNR